MLSSAVSADLTAPSNNAPVNIKADNMQYNMNTGVSEYQGNVRVTQNGIELAGDKVIAYQENKELQKIRVHGSPAVYKQLADDGSYINAQSLQMDYLAASNRLILTKNARLEQAGNIVESEKIVYDTVEEIIIAGNEDSSERVNITITPDKTQQQ